MGRFRNPRFALESLERKLSPSGSATLAVAAEVFIPAANTNTNLVVAAEVFIPAANTNSPTPDDDGGDGGDGGDPPIGTPTIPNGPTQPA